MWSLRFAALAVLALLSLPLRSAFAQDSLNVSRLGGLSVLPRINHMVLVGQSTYVTASPGLHILNISNETQPHEVGVLGLPSTAYSIVVSGNLAYVGCQSHVQILDISDETHPQVVATLFENQYRGFIVAADQGLLCVQESFNADSLYVLDVTDPTNPNILSTVSDMWGYNSLVIRDSILYCGSSSSYFSGVRVFDLHNPAAPVQIATVDSLRFVEGFVLRGDSLYVAGYGRLYIANVANPANPTVAATYSAESNPGYSALAVDGNLLYVASSRGLRIFDISTPNQIALMCTTSTACLRYSNNVASRSHRAFVATDYCGSLHILNTEDPSSPVEVGMYDTPTSVENFAVSGVHAFAPGMQGLHIGDVSNPFLPSFVGSYSQSLDDNTQIVVRDDYAYLVSTISSEDSSVLHILDVANPIEPIAMSSTVLPPGMRTVALANHLLYVAPHLPEVSSGFVFAVFDPANPIEIGTFEIPPFVSCFASDDDVLYVGTSNGLVTYSLADPVMPVEMGAIAGDWYASSIALLGSFVCVSANSSLLHIIDASVPQMPWIIASLPLPGCRTVQIRQTHAFVAAGVHGLYVIDLSNPSSPDEVGAYDSDRYFGPSLTAQDSLIYVAEDDGLGIYRWTSTTSVSPTPNAVPNVLALSAYPNPFNSTTQLRFELSKSSRVELSIVNTLGQRVALLTDKDYTAGAHALSWDASEVASGIYFAYLRAGEQSRVMKMVLIK